MDPFEVSALTGDEIAERERQFVKLLADNTAMSAASWLEFDILYDRQSEGGS